MSDPALRGFFVVAAFLVVGGLVAVTIVELTAEQRRLVGKVRDAIEIMLPVAATLALVYLVWLRLP